VEQKCNAASSAGSVDICFSVPEVVLLCTPTIGGFLAYRLTLSEDRDVIAPEQKYSFRMTWSGHLLLALLVLLFLYTIQDEKCMYNVPM